MLMHSARSAPRAAAAATSTGVSGIERHPDAEAVLPRDRDHLLGIGDRLDVEGDAVATRGRDLGDVVHRVVDHQVAVEHAAVLVHERCDRAQHDRADRDRWDEVPVADVEVEDPRPGAEQLRDLLTEPAEVGRVERRLDLGAAPHPVAPPHAVDHARCSSSAQRIMSGCDAVAAAQPHASACTTAPAAQTLAVELERSVRMSSRRRIRASHPPCRAASGGRAAARQRRRQDRRRAAWDRSRASRARRRRHVGAVADPGAGASRTLVVAAELAARARRPRRATPAANGRPAASQSRGSSSRPARSRRRRAARTDRASVGDRRSPRSTAAAIAVASLVVVDVPQPRPRLAPLDAAARGARDRARAGARHRRRPSGRAPPPRARSPARGSSP